jgi:aerobic carbon-monoxide dehydrogenase small subunit
LVPITLHVNGRDVRRDAEPRTHLGDFLRDELHLTGTHLGCEHGVCGACTVLLDGQPARSCITFAVACEGSEVTTIEGYDGDAAMRLLREAFTRHHALQCGFCTPGMLATARDIVLRLPTADEARVRVELAGNLCRCTGYQGIVDAILDVLRQLRDTPDPQIEQQRARTRASMRSQGSRLPVPGRLAASSPAPASAAPAEAISDPNADLKAITKGTTIEASFEVPFPIEKVWTFMGDLPAVASCLPGATITAQEGEKVKGSIAIKFGPMSAAFVGAARLERDDAAKRAILRGAGQDSLSKSRAQGDIAYHLHPSLDGTTRVQIEMIYALQGPLAQFSRSGLVKDFVRRMVADFGTQVTSRLGGNAGHSQASPRAVSVPHMLWDVLWRRLRRWFGAGTRQP